MATVTIIVYNIIIYSIIISISIISIFQAPSIFEHEASIRTHLRSVGGRATVKTAR